MSKSGPQDQKGFSLLELLIAMTVTLMLMAIITEAIFRANAVNARETRKADALVSAQAALNVMTREVGNTGFGLFTDATSQTPSNGIILADSNDHQLHFRSNFDNVGDYSVPPGSTVLDTNQPGEDLTYFFDSATNSIVRYDPHPTSGEPNTSVIVNKVSNVTFEYYNYTTSSSAVTATTTPTTATGRIRITVLVALEPVVGEPDNQTVTFTSDVTLRNSNYMLRQY